MRVISAVNSTILSLKPLCGLAVLSPDLGISYGRETIATLPHGTDILTCIFSNHYACAMLGGKEFREVIEIRECLCENCVCVVD